MNIFKLLLLFSFCFFFVGHSSISYQSMVNVKYTYNRKAPGPEAVISNQTVKLLLPFSISGIL